MNLEALVEEFASHVAAQTEAMKRGMPGTGNRHARRSMAAFEKLRAQGDAGMSALATLLTHPRLDVRALSASYLLDHGHRAEQALAVLEEAAQGEGLVAFGASQSLERWRKTGGAPDSDAPTSPERPRRQHRIPSRPQARHPLELPASLTPQRPLLEGALAPCILFDKTEGSPHSRGCRYGGLPLVPKGTQWPRSPEGPLHFLGQLDFAELSACRGDALPELPEEGLLAFFYDIENQPWGNEPTHRAFWQLVYVPPGAEPVPLQPPEDLLEAERPVLPPCRLTPSLGLSLPGWWDLRAPVDPGFWSDAQADDYSELRRQLAGGVTVDQAVDQVRGHPDWVQDDARVQTELVSQGLSLDDAQAPAELERRKQRAAQWNLLWQVGSDEEWGVRWGSSGTLYLLIRDDDLKSLRFNQAWLILQCT